ncbi:hypothetical protein BgiBS90_006642, partial [Biomphalaria glabrata]
MVERNGDREGACVWLREEGVLIRYGWVTVIREFETRGNTGVYRVFLNRDICR